jgi:importin subunit alpha-1
MALSNYSNTKNKIFLQILINRGVVSFIMTLDSNTPLRLIACTLRIIGNLLSGDDFMVEEIIRYGVINLCDKLLFHTNPTIRRESAWCLSNIAAGTKTQIALLVESGVFPKLVELVRDQVADVSREALWAICNCITGSEIDLCFKMGSLGVFDALIYTLAHYKEAHILAIALEGIFSIFSVGDIISQFNSSGNPFVDYFVNAGGVEHLDKLQNHNNQEIFNLTINIIDKFFTSKQA